MIVLWLTQVLHSKMRKMGIVSTNLTFYVQLQKLIHYLSINLRISSVVRPSLVFADLLAKIWKIHNIKYTIDLMSWHYRRRISNIS